MDRSTVEQAVSSVPSPVVEQVQRVIDLIKRATRDTGEAEGIVLALTLPGLPSVTGWFHPDVSPGFSATFPHIIHDTLAAADSSSVRSPATAPGVGAAPRTTWSHVKIGAHYQAIGELWLYRGQKSVVCPVTDTSIEGPSASITAILEHIRHWHSDPLDQDAYSALHAFARSLNSVADFDGVCDAVAREFQTVLSATGVAVELFGDDHTLNAAATSGPTPIRDGIYMSGRTDATSIVHGEDTVRGEWLFDLFSLVSVDGELLGAVTCFWNDQTPPRTNLSLIEMMTDQAAAAIARSYRSRHSTSRFWSAARAMADAVDARDSYTRHHARRVARYSRQIAEQLELPADEVGVIEVAGLLHDVGKIGVPDRVLQMTGELGPDDWDLIRRHPEIGGSLVATFPDLVPVVPLIRHHHERYDGTGYPTGLRGKDIPIGARIISLVEAFDTLVSGRPYQSPWNVERTLATLESLGGTQFDPEIAGFFCEAIRAGSIQVEIPALTQTGDLDLHRWIGAEARAFALLQRIGNEVGELIELDRFLTRLQEIVASEFPDSVVDIFVRDRENDHFFAIPDGTRPHLERNGVYVMKPDRGIIGWVARHGLSQNVSDVREDERYVVSGDRPMRSELAVPMVLDNVCVGVVNLESPQESAYSRTDEKVLETIASYVARALQVAELHSHVKQQNDIDSMTGLLNHRAFYRTLEFEVERAARAKSGVSVAVIDVDAFKRVNDSMGHVWGDAVIRRLARILNRSVRHGDAVARYGGDEFAIVMPGASRDAIERRMRAIEDEILAESEDGSLPRISWGIARFPEDGLRPTELVAQADAAMYAVKQRSATSA